MKVLITGATGFIGSHITAALRGSGHSVIGCVRDPVLGERINSDIDYIACDFTHDMLPETWVPRLRGVDIVVNAVGIITEAGKSTFRSIHVDAPKALFDACKKTGIKRVIQISALGVGMKSHTVYNDTKMEADDYLLSLGIPAAVLRPSWLYGDRSASFDLLCGFSALPVIPVVGNGDYMVQPIFIEDFAKAVAALIGTDALDGKIVEVGGPEQLSIKGMHVAFRKWLGKTTTPVWCLPEWIVKHAVKLGDHVFKGPVNTASFDMLTRHNITADTRLWEITKIQPQPIAKVLSQFPASAAVRMQANLYFLLPLLRYSLAFVWIASAVVTGMIAPRQETLELFTETGIEGSKAEWLLYISCAFDFLMGLTLLFNFHLRIFAWMQIVLMLFYTLFISLRAPEWWLHPYGPIVKNIPMIAATLIILATVKRK